LLQVADWNGTYWPVQAYSANFSFFRRGTGMLMAGVDDDISDGTQGLALLRAFLGIVSTEN
jgi:hypothetical protein